MTTDPYHTPPEIERHPEARLQWRTGAAWEGVGELGHTRTLFYDDCGHAALYRFVMAWAYVAGDLDA